MEMTVNEVRGATLIVLRGRLDIQAAAAIEAKFNAAAGSRDALIVDLSGVDYISSLGIRLLLIAGKAVAARKGKMALVRPQPDIAGLLHSAGIDPVIPIYESRDAAIGAVTYA